MRMASIILHAGMPKAGSSAIQRWLGSLRDDPIQGLTPVVVRIGSPPVALSVQRHTAGTTNSGVVVEEMRRAGDDATHVVHQLMSGLDDAAQRHGRIVLSGEALSQPFWQKDRGFLDVLDQLARSHAVVVVYYVRPQDTALEAAWRQWGFRSNLPPERYVRHRAAQMDYLDTLRSVRQAAPHIDFRMRPFRRDLLSGGDVVSDFANHGLGHTLPTAGEEWNSNLGLPLDVVNLLAVAPSGLLGNSPHDNRRFTVVKTALADTDIPTSTAAAEGRTILRAWAYERFEASNHELIRELGWDTDHFISPELDTVGDLSQLDACWRPRASEAELATFFGLFKEFVLSTEHHSAPAEQLRALEQKVDEMRSQLAASANRREAAEQKLDALLNRRAVKAALRGADLVARVLGRR